MYDNTPMAGIIIQEADGDDELAEAALDQVVGAEPPPPTTDHRNA